MGGGNLVTLKYSIGLLALSLLQLPGTGAGTTYYILTNCILLFPQKPGLNPTLQLVC